MLLDKGDGLLVDKVHEESGVGNAHIAAALHHDKLQVGADCVHEVHLGALPSFTLRRSRVHAYDCTQLRYADLGAASM